MEARLRKILRHRGRNASLCVSPEQGLLHRRGTRRLRRRAHHNHCCDPNLATRRLAGHIIFFSRRRIAAGEELTLDYRYRPNGPRKACRCGSPKCRGTINLYKDRQN